MTGGSENSEDRSRLPAHSTVGANAPILSSGERLYLRDPLAGEAGTRVDYRMMFIPENKLEFGSLGEELR